jgi:hypothetical protein
MDIPFAVTIGMFGLGMILVLYGTVTRNRWGINMEEVNCPRCYKPMPRIRQPKSLSQTLWGGWTCEHCGCQVDKWGHEVGSRT